MTVIPTLTTQRLVLRGWTPDDVPQWQRICADPPTMRFIGDGTPMPEGRAWHALAHLLGHWALRGYGLWAVTDRTDGALIGRAGLYNPAGWPGLEIGWLIDRQRWGRGFATEAATAAAAWAFEELDIGELISLIRVENRASVRVAEKLGARHDGQIHNDGGAVEVYRLSRPHRA